MNREEQTAATTAFIAAIAEGVRLFGGAGVNEDSLYASVSTLADRAAFDMVVRELIAQKTLKRNGLDLVYCGPCAYD